MAKGFNKGPQMGQGGMMQQLQRMQKQMEEAQAKLAEETVTATAGGGAIKVVMTGDQKCQSVEISPDLLKDADAEMLQDLVLAASIFRINVQRIGMPMTIGHVTQGDQIQRQQYRTPQLVILS